MSMGTDLSTERTEGRAAARDLIRFMITIGILWVLFEGLWLLFPFIRNGTQVIIDAKFAAVRSGEVFKGEAGTKARVVIFGDSRVLCGFKPSIYDEMSQGTVTSYNVGIPNEKGFVEQLDILVHSDKPPTHVFMMVPWFTTKFEPTVWNWFERDRVLMDRTFPFRSMPRDLAVFAGLARNRGGWSAFYKFGMDSAKQVLDDRGYYFISGSSHYPNDRLPDDFSLPSDHPERVEPRKVQCIGPYFEKLKTWADEFNIQFVFVPEYHRELSVAPAPATNEETLRELAPYPRFTVAGPDYFRYPNRLFSDPVHANREGAELYTQDVWRVTAHLFSSRAASDNSESGGGE